MRLSNFLLNTTKKTNTETKLISHKLMLQSGMIKQISSGVYCWLPLGLKVLKKIESIVRSNLNSICCNEVLLPSLQPLSLWEKSGRALEESDLKSQIFHIKCSKHNEYVLPPSGEEVVSRLFTNSIRSYKYVNKILYQITWKFRNEIRPKHGIIRAREFLMKDAYSFDISKKNAMVNYEKVFRVYLQIFKILNLQVIPVLASSGAMGGNYSHEFHVLSQNGESVIYYQDEILKYIKGNVFSIKNFEQYYSREKEKHSSNVHNILQSKSIEIGHLFYLGQKYSKALECTFQDKDGKFKFTEMGCYGIGISRLVAVIIENNYDEKGIVWPNAVAPFKLVIINSKIKNEICRKFADRIYQTLSERYDREDILYDDTDSNVNKKFTDANLIGIVWQLVIRLKEKKQLILELINRKTGEVRNVEENYFYRFYNSL